MSTPQTIPTGGNRLLSLHPIPSKNCLRRTERTKKICTPTFHSDSISKQVQHITIARVWDSCNFRTVGLQSCSTAHLPFGGPHWPCTWRGNINQNNRDNHERGPLPNSKYDFSYKQNRYISQVWRKTHDFVHDSGRFTETHGWEWASLVSANMQ